MRKNKNDTLFLLAGICVVLTVPIAAVIIKKVQAGMVTKTVMIMIVFLVLLVAVLLLYKNIYGMTVQEIAQEEKVTELDRLSFSLTECRRKHVNPQFQRCIDIVSEQILTFKRRSAVLLQITGSGTGTADSGAIGSLIQTVEEALIHNIERLMNRAKIFDDRGSREMIKENIGYMESFLFKNNEILADFEKLITEASQMGEDQDDTNINKLRDVIAAMQSLRKDPEDEIDELAKKYRN